MNNTKDIPGYEGLYSIDKQGRVYSYKSNRYIKGGTLYTGHKTVCLYKNKAKRIHSVHRLVAEAFIPNPDNFLIVHHIDGNPQNNSVDNLKWCTQKENVHHCIVSGKFGKMSRGKKKTQ